MPTTPPAPCPRSGCRQRRSAPGRLCQDHEPERQRSIDARRGTTKERGYAGKWPELRKVVLARDPVCKHPGCEAWSKHVDHIIPKAQGGKDELSNLQGLCHPHHSEKTAREDGGFGRGGGGRFFDGKRFLTARPPSHARPQVPQTPVAAGSQVGGL